MEYAAEIFNGHDYQRTGAMLHKGAKVCEDFGRCPPPSAVQRTGCEPGAVGAGLILLMIR